MRIFALELNNDIKNISKRKEYIESLISQLSKPDLVLLPELALPSYIPNHKIWKYADDSGKEASRWAMEMAKKYSCYIGIGYVDYDDRNYYNRYLIADKNQVYGVVTKSEGEAAVFKRGWFDNLIKTPFGNVAIAICYDARREHFYKNIKDEKVSLIVFPHGSPANPKKEIEEMAVNDYFCNLYAKTFGVPVVYVNSYGKLEYMPGITGLLMKLSSFSMNGKSKIYASGGEKIVTKLKRAQGYECTLLEKARKNDLIFYKGNLVKENEFFRKLLLKPDIYIGVRKYNRRLEKIHGARKRRK